LYFDVLNDGTIRFPTSLQLVVQLDLEKDVQRLSDTARDQLSELIETSLLDKYTDVQVLTNEDFAIFKLLRKALGSKIDSPVPPFENQFL